MAGLEGRVALVTGASQGIGKAIALQLAKDGATVALAARNEAKLAGVKSEIEAIGGKAEAFTLDVSSEDAIKTTAKDILARLGAVHILVNNAGVTRDGLVLRMKSADWDDVLTTNLKGSFLLTQALLQPMMKARWGRIINIASVNGELGAPGQANYAASKAGLIGLTKSLAREFASRNITANAVAPGFIETDMTHVLTDDQKKAMLSAVPLARAGTVADIAYAVSFLASEGASYITGHTLDVNGGLYMG